MSYQTVLSEQIRIDCVLFIMKVIGAFIVAFVPGSHPVSVKEPYQAVKIIADNNTDNRFTINSEGCTIPYVDLNEISIRNLINSAAISPSSCPSYKHSLLAENGTHITTVTEHFKLFKIVNESNLKCCYRSFYRASFGASKNTFTRIKFSKCRLFQSTTKVNDEFVKVNCYYNGKEIYKRLFLFTPKKPFTTARKEPFTSERSMYNIIIMGLGSMSRHNFYRTMYKTWNFMKQYEAVELKGYNTVAADSFQNLIAVLLGLNKLQLHNICSPGQPGTLDNCPFIWERFKDVGYYTAFAEDSGKFGVFNKENLDFKDNPTDYYIHPFVKQFETFMKNRQKPQKHNKYQDSVAVTSCIGDKHNFQVLLDYIDSLVTTLDQSKLFGLFWETTMSHDNLNYPLQMDDAYALIIKKLKLSGYLNNTILILMSDHGINSGGIQFTKQGQLEVRLPLLYILIPKLFRNEFKLAYQNLLMNQQRLTTPYDVHTTLIDLLGLSDLSDEEIRRRSTEPYSHNRGISLFLPIPGNRTCQMAEIDQEWCSCHKLVKFPISNALIKSASRYLTQRLNEKIKLYPQCMGLAVAKVIEVHEIIPVYERNVEWRDFQVRVSTAPGGGNFEAVLRHHKGWTLVDDIKRMDDTYKHSCTRDDYVNGYCYCG
ncbi:uncharacterized protein LOC142987579 [Anticarsia gemmatalis]|uniref:uncharacterized protein LOC142987579 n=1 Tax=Anticarsia gemmatalis TaxID=129554 RepID=UPI003F773775